MFSHYNFHSIIFWLFEFKSVDDVGAGKIQRNAHVAYKPTRRSRKVHTKRWLWASGQFRELKERIIDRCSTWVIDKHNLWAKYFTSWRHHGWRLDCKLSYSVKRTTQLLMNVRWILKYEMDVHERGTWQLCLVRRLAFPLNVSFYLMQHTPLWRSKFRILRIKKTRTKIGTLRISHTSWKLHRDIPSGSFTKTNLRKIGAITDNVWWLSRA